MRALPILPSVVDSMPERLLDPLSREFRKNALDRLERRRAAEVDAGPPDLPGLHLFSGEYGSPVSLLAGFWAHMYYAAGRTVISNDDLLFGHALDQAAHDGTSLVAQSPDRCVLYLNEFPSLCAPRAGRRHWSDRQMKQVLDDAAMRGVTILLIPSRGGRLPDAFHNVTLYQHIPWRPPFTRRLSAPSEHIPTWSLLRESLRVRVIEDAGVRLQQYQNPLTIRSAGVVSAAACQWLARPAPLDPGDMDPDRAQDLGSLSPEETYEAALLRVKARVADTITLPVLRIMDWYGLGADGDRRGGNVI